MKIKEERDQLEKLINTASDINNGLTPNAADIPDISAEPTMVVDFDELRFQCNEEAEMLIKKSIAFSIPPEMLENNEYLAEKLKNDSFAMSAIIYQLRCCELVQRSLMEQIKSGMTHPRMYEVFAGLVKSTGEINKQMIQTVEALSSTYKNLKLDMREMSNEALGPRQEQGMITTGDGSIITRGTKEIINESRKMKNFKRENVENVEDVKVND